MEAGTLMGVPVRTASGFATGSAERLFSHPTFSALIEPNYDVAADGRKFLLPESSGGQERMIRVVQNWFAEFRDRR